MTIITPFPYQRECLERLEETRRQDITRALVVMATGLGKTVVAALDAKEVIEKKSWRVLYLAHQNQILEQAKETFEEILGVSATYGFFTGDEKVLEEVTCLFASFQTMANWREDFYEDEFDYVIVDESHHSHAETYLPTIKYFKPKFLLAITATPDRKDLRNIRELYGNEIFSITLEEALAKGYLTPIEYLLLIDEIQAQQVVETPSGKLSIKELNRRLFIPMRDEKIAATILEKTEGVKNPRTLIFCSSIRHCENIAKLMPNAAALHSKAHFSDRRTRLAAFRSGDISTLVTVDQFNEGIDIPAANVIVFLRSTSSRTIFLQQLGRGLRRAEGKDSVLVLDFAGNCERMERVAELASNVRRLREEFDSLDATRDEGISRDSVVVDHDGEFYFTELVQDVLDIVSEARRPYDPSRPVDYSREALVKALKTLAKKLGRNPTSTDVAAASKEGSSVSVSQYLRVFGTFNGALRAAGLKLNSERLTRQELIDYLQRRADELGRVPTGVEIDSWSKAGEGPSTGPYRENWGLYSLAAKEIVLGKGEETTRSGLIANLQQLAQDLGRTPMRKDVLSSPTVVKYPWKAYLNEFGSYTEAVLAAGLTPNRNPGKREARYTKDQVFKRYCAISDLLGRPAQYRDLEAASKADPGVNPSAPQYRKYFGSFAIIRAEYLEYLKGQQGG